MIPVWYAYLLKIKIWGGESILTLTVRHLVTEMLKVSYENSLNYKVAHSMEQAKDSGKTLRLLCPSQSMARGGKKNYWVT